jgi:hypothetical protein
MKFKVLPLISISGFFDVSMPVLLLFIMAVSSCGDTEAGFLYFAENSSFR